MGGGAGPPGAGHSGSSEWIALGLSLAPHGICGPPLCRIQASPHRWGVAIEPLSSRPGEGESSPAFDCDLLRVGHHGALTL